MKYLVSVILASIVGCGSHKKAYPQEKQFSNRTTEAIGYLSEKGIDFSGVRILNNTDESGNILGMCVKRGSSRVITIYENHFVNSVRDIRFTVLHEMMHCKFLIWEHEPIVSFYDGCSKNILSTFTTDSERSKACWDKHEEFYLYQYTYLQNILK